MLVSIEGAVSDKSPSRVTLILGGLGYGINISSKTYDTLPSVGEVVFLHLYTHVREDAISLFGFTHLADKETFLSLLKVPKIGPKLGLSILGELDTPTLISTILSEDTATLKKCNGVGQKTAELIIVQLRDKMHAQSQSQSSQAAASLSSSTGKHSAKMDAISALENFGYRAKEIDAIIPQACAQADSQTVEGIIRQALQLLQRK